MTDLQKFIEETINKTLHIFYEIDIVKQSNNIFDKIYAKYCLSIFKKFNNVTPIVTHCTQYI